MVVWLRCCCVRTQHMKAHTTYESSRDVSVQRVVAWLRCRCVRTQHASKYQNPTSLKTPDADDHCAGTPVVHNDYTVSTLFTPIRTTFVSALCSMEGKCKRDVHRHQRTQLRLARNIHIYFIRIYRVGQNRIFRYIYTVYLVISKPEIPYVHRIYMVRANSTHIRCTYDIFQRGLSGQKPKHAPFCINGAITHTSLHQIGPNLALN